MKEELEAWKSKIGLSYIGRPEDDPIKRALNFTYNELLALPPDELGDLLLCLTNYYIYLQSESGHIYARLRFMRGKLDQAVYAQSTKQSVFSLEERRAIIIEGDEELLALSDTINAENIKLDILKPITEAIKVKIDATTKLVYGRFNRRKDE